MNDKSNKEFWDKFAKLYALFMRKDQGVYNQVCRYIYPYLNRGMNVLDMTCIKMIQFNATYMLKIA